MASRVVDSQCETHSKVCDETRALCFEHAAVVIYHNASREGHGRSFIANKDTDVVIYHNGRVSQFATVVMLNNEGRWMLQLQSLNTPPATDRHIVQRHCMFTI